MDVSPISCSFKLCGVNYLPVGHVSYFSIDPLLKYPVLGYFVDYRMGEIGVDWDSVNG